MSSTHLKDGIINCHAGPRGFMVIFSFTRTHHLVFLVPAFICACVCGLVKPATSILIGRYLTAVSQFAADPSDESNLVHQTKMVVFAMAAVAGGTLLAKTGFYWAFVMYGEAQARAVRNDLFATLLERDLGWFDSQKSGVSTSLNRLQTHIHDFQRGVSLPLGLATTSIAQSLASLGVAFSYSWKLSFILLATFSCVAFALSLISIGGQQLVDGQQSELTSATKHVTHILTNIVLIISNNTQMEEISRYTEILDRLSGIFEKQIRKATVQIGVTRLAAGATTMIALFVGAVFVHDDHTSPGSILTTFWCCMNLSTGLDEILKQIMFLEKSRSAAAALEGVLRGIEEGKRGFNSTHGLTPARLEGDIELKNVSFSYPNQPDRQVLHDATLFFPAHETTFVVGKSGSGKSTLSNLLLKFYQPTTGKIRIDGYDIRKLDTAWLRNNMTLVQQSSFLFNESILNNLTVFYDDTHLPPTEHIDEAVEFAELKETVARLPAKLNTAVGKGGASLSGGQKQRIALARARLRDTSVLILDEATSALDETAKVRIMRSLRKWRKEKTTVIITHDLSQIRSGDFVYVLKDGEVVAEGYRSAAQVKLEEMQGHKVVGTSPSSTAGLEKLKTPDRPRVEEEIRPDPVKLHSDASNRSVDDGSFHDVENEARSLRPKPGVCQKGHQNFASVRALLPQWSRPPVRSDLRIRGQPMDEQLGAEHQLMQRPDVSRYGRLHSRMRVAQIPKYLRPQTRTSTRYHYQIENLTFEAPQQCVTISDPAADAEPEMFSTARPTTDPPTAKSFALRQVLSTVWPCLSARYRMLLVLGIATAVLHAMVPSASAWAMVHLFGTFSQTLGWVQTARKWSAILIAIGFLDGATGMMVHYLFEKVSHRWVRVLRQEALRAIVHQPKSWFDSGDFSTTEICCTLDKAADEIGELLSRVVCYALIASIMVSVAVLWSFAKCWKLTFVVLAHVPLVAGLTKFFDFTSQRWQARTAEAAEMASEIFSETFSDVRTVRTLTIESHFHHKYSLAVSRTFKAGIQQATWTGICYGASESAILFITAPIFHFASVFARAETCSTESVLTVLSLILFAMMGAATLFSYIPQVSTGVRGGAQLITLARLKYTQIAKMCKKRVSEDLRGDINFNHVGFSYPARPNVQILRKLTLSIPAGQFVALVGRSGCGKSTIISLILGLYMVDDGSLGISSQHIAQPNLKAIRSLISYLPQQPVLMPMDIRANILYGQDSRLVTEEALQSAARAAGIHSFITSLPLGYDTVVGDGGVRVSGGQAQRIALARAFARSPKILLLDEPTSALDDESSKVIQSSLREIMKQPEAPTIVMVTHSKDMMRLADRVVVLENGTVSEDGGYDDLLKHHGKLWQLLRDEVENT